MSLLGVLQTINAEQEKAMQPADMMTGVVTSTDPLAITTDIHKAELRKEVLVLTSSVIEKYITGAEQCYENGEPLPSGSGKVILNRALALNDKVLLLSVQHGQKFIVLSRLY